MKKEGEKGEYLINPKDMENLLKIHFVYEVNMLIESYKFLDRQVRSKNIDKYLKNVAIEEVYLHARCLYEFLLEKYDCHEDTALAVHYIDKSWGKKIDEIFYTERKDWYENFRRHANKELSHLTYSRKNPNSIPSDSDPYIKDIAMFFCLIVLEFINLLPENYKYPEVTNLIDQINNFMQEYNYSYMEKNEIKIDNAIVNSTTSFINSGRTINVREMD